MKDEIKELKEQIEVLEARVDELEGKERRRKIWSSIKTIFKLVLFLAICIGLYYGYRYVRYELPTKVKDYITEQLPALVEEAVDEKSEELTDSVNDKTNSILDKFKKYFN